MTRKELMQIRYLNSEIKMWQEELDNLKGKSEVSSPAFDQPNARAPGKFNSSVENKAVRQADIRKIIEGKLAELTLLRTEIMIYISTLDDTLLRQIIFFRCVSCMGWDQVARMIGSGTTPDSLRMIFNRAFPYKK